MGDRFHQGPFHLNNLGQFEKALLAQTWPGGLYCPGFIWIQHWKKQGVRFFGPAIAHLTRSTEDAVRAERNAAGLVPSYRLVDVRGGIRGVHALLLFHHDRGDDEKITDRKKVMILGGPNRIGQGIEFDYCCVHAAFALKEDGFETLMVNSNPETVSTDYDTSDKLFFEPLTLEDVLHIYEREQCWGVMRNSAGRRH